ncbi:ABC-F family ATP-binding cassette domain-containing protein [Desulfitobacterium hafniense]|uniref:ABC transporter domain-containing protein n=5 Tax=root TaxID=1 RepID=Q24W27_DESHY|nr:ABC-F family ATP-binding cassette domain-containing protein [Desulfitobacterium hafniense]ACL21157.1 ABC transporter related [Desulfitobacterium hafniense DCB-2]EHL06522.1 ABC transporter, ATP-binding protein [Desulfitobacterium hafniense DP7]KTE93200.1 heme ABC transporter ATP-binding protein [Desulfitobacterium hafniense]MEA5022250.1 ABC-F family ATP-binding cassette domain-containing protein [Desulfitobacterium hafniense]CDX02054.1 ABC transporter F member 2 [Desulfitobacterium hafniense
MSILNVENVNHGFGGRKILENTTFRLLKGEHVGLVGANGEGKSTFLDIITGKLIPDEGKVEWSNRVSVGYLDQHTVLTQGKSIRDVLREAFQKMFELEAEMLELYNRMAEATEAQMNKMMEDVGEIQTILESNGFYMIDAKVEEVANGLGLGEIGLDKDVADLSGGQRTKVLLTKLLLQKPTILILDEPTNYLDAEHIIWLSNYLKDYENAFILVSHDIPFLNDVVNVIYHVENADLTRYTGNYEQFMQLYNIKKEQELKAYEKQQKEVDRLEDFIARNKARISTTGRAKSRQKQLDRMEILEKPKEKIKPQFRFKEARSPGRVIFEAKDLVLGYNEPLTRPLSLHLERGQKVAIRGVNGLGKTTLLKTLLGIIPSLSGEVILGDYLYPGYFEQESSRGNTNTPIEEIWQEFPGLTNYEVRQALAKCGLTNEHISNKMMVLSGGESAKVRLCKLMLKDINFLVLDEPTNHLDVDAKDELKKAIREFKGTVLLVSHDPDFYSDWVSDIWNLEQWTTKIV